MNINQTIIIGFAGKDAEIIYFDSGKTKTTFSVGVKPPYATSDNTPPLWVEVETWGKIAEVAASYVKKGKQVSIRGRYKQERWQDKNSGALRCKPILIADELLLLGKKNSNLEETY
ncbi:MAG: single-stranded DNA-binding protein [Richelia sp. RM1_1_1]|nr:single-stranded DNA-binding protein [Richelia sp. RM1_1_1]